MEHTTDLPALLQRRVRRSGTTHLAGMRYSDTNQLNVGDDATPVVVSSSGFDLLKTIQRSEAGGED